MILELNDVRENQQLSMGTTPREMFAHLNEILTLPNLKPPSENK